MLLRFSACLLLAALPAASFGCDSSEAPAPAPAAPAPAAQATGSPRPRPEAVAYSVPERSEEELARELERTCAEARQAKVPVLLEFSAPWCKDCVRLQAMKADPALGQALARYRFLSINVGDFDRHPALLSGFGIRAIAHWEALAPTDCKLPPWQWQRRGRRTLEPESGRQKVSAEDLAKWLEARSAT